MTQQSAIINPVPPKSGPPLPPLAIMVGSLPDLSVLCGLLGRDKTKFRGLTTSRLYHQPGDVVALAGPMIGAPCAVMLLETLIAWGAKKIIFYGWCGAVSPSVEIGDIIVPTGAYIDEGTSLHYKMKTGDKSEASKEISETITNALSKKKLPHHTGPIWTTDGFFRETPEKVTHFQKKRALAVEMELSALFTVAAFRKVAMGAALVVSDTLADLTWHQGFKEKSFKTQRRALCEVISRICLAK